MITQAKMYIAGAALLAVLGMGLTLWYQNGRIDRLKSDNAALNLGLATAVGANTENVKTIGELKKEREKSGRSCAKQVADKDKLINELRKIDETDGGTHEQAGNGNMDGTGGGDTGGGDALLDLLNGMLPAADGGQASGVCQAGSPSVAAGASVVSGDVLYCLNEVSAKNLLKDFALCRAWANEGVIAIEGMR